MVQRVRSAVAVDFGTTTSLVARRTGRAPATVVPLTPTTAWLPSLVTRAGEGYAMVDPAEQVHPGRLIRSVKRAITERRLTVPIGGVPGNPEVFADDVIRTILLEVRRRALAAGRSLARVSEIRMGCPAMWDGPQRRRLLEVVSTTGMTVPGESLIEEPVAAGVAWLAAQHVPVRGRLLVFDMGGGTLDVAVLDVAGGEQPEIAVLASRGVPIAGDRLDDAIAADLMAHLPGEPVRPDAARADLHWRAGRVKVALSARKAVTVVLPPRILGRVPEVTYSRDRLEEVFAPLLADAEREISVALHGLGTVDFVLLAGGMSRMPVVRARLRELFPGAAVAEPDELDPVEAVVGGLTDTVGYDLINLPCPGFDFVLTWDEGMQWRTLYEAHTPLESGFERRGLGLPTDGTGWLTAVSTAGKPVELVVDGTVSDRLPVSFGPGEFVFRLSCDGEIALTDGRGRQRVLRIKRWPVLSGRGDALTLTSVAAPRSPAGPGRDAAPGRSGRTG